MKTKTIDRFILAFTALLVISSTIYAFLYINEWTKTLILFTYFVPIVILFMFWIKFQIINPPKMKIILFANVLVSVLAGLRFFEILSPFLPYSGHVLFVIYSIATVKDKKFRIFAGMLFALTTFFKIFIWHDYFSWLAGMIISMPFVAIAILFDSSKKIDTNE